MPLAKAVYKLPQLRVTVRRCLRKVSVVKREGNERGRISLSSRGIHLRDTSPYPSIANRGPAARAFSARNHQRVVDGHEMERRFASRMREEIFTKGHLEVRGGCSEVRFSFLQMRLTVVVYLFCRHMPVTRIDDGQGGQAGHFFFLSFRGEASLPFSLPNCGKAALVLYPASGVPLFHVYRM